MEKTGKNSALPRLILASQSPTRRALLARTGLEFTTRPADVDERAIETEALAAGRTPADIAALLAAQKARVVSTQQPGAVVIGADQVLASDGTIFHKPATLAAARAQLWALRGRTHDLHTAFCLVQDGKILAAYTETAAMTLRAFSRTEMEEVLTAEGDAVLGSVGGYRLEGPAIRLFDKIEGDYFAILGLPLLPLLAALRKSAAQ